MHDIYAKSFAMPRLAEILTIPNHSIEHVKHNFDSSLLAVDNGRVAVILQCHLFFIPKNPWL